MEVPFLVAASDRRSVRRYVRLECEVVRERGFRLIGKRALDMSTTGMRIAAIDDAVPGESVVFAFRAPGSAIWIDGEGTVARVAAGRRREDFGESIGVALEIPTEVRVLLRRHLLRCPPPPPKRGARVDYAATVRRISMGGSI
ncbi:MAG: PilZ domain-containing protein [Polyangiales bacterium]